MERYKFLNRIPTCDFPTLPLFQLYPAIQSQYLMVTSQTEPPCAIGPIKLEQPSGPAVCVDIPLGSLVLFHAAFAIWRRSRSISSASWSQPF